MHLRDIFMPRRKGPIKNTSNPSILNLHLGVAGEGGDPKLAAANAKANHVFSEWNFGWVAGGERVVLEVSLFGLVSETMFQKRCVLEDPSASIPACILRKFGGQQAKSRANRRKRIR